MNDLSELSNDDLIDINRENLRAIACFKLITGVVIFVNVLFFATLIYFYAQQ